MNPRSLASDLLMLLCGDEVDSVSVQAKADLVVPTREAFFFFFFSEKVTNLCSRHFESVVQIYEAPKGHTIIRTISQTTKWEHKEKKKRLVRR